MRRLYLFSLFFLIFFSACDASPGYTSTGASASLSISVNAQVVSTISPTAEPTHTSSPEPVPTSAPTPTPLPVPTPTPVSVYAPTVNMSFEELVGDDGYYKDPAGFPPSGTYRIIVDIYHQVVMVYSKGNNGEYNVPVRYMLCSTGLHGSTPTGAFKMQRYHVRFGLFHVEQLYGQYWSEIKGRIYFHTILYTQRDASTYIKETYDKLGEPDSHGCIRLTVPDARWIYYNIAPGTKVVIRKGSKGDSATSQIRSQLVLIPSPKENIKLVRGEVPDTDNWKIAELPSDVPFKQGSQS